MAELRVALVGEDAVHRALGMALLDAAWTAVACAKALDWLTDCLDQKWVWADHALSTPDDLRFTKISTTLPLEWKGRRLRVHGHIDGRPVGNAGRRFRHWLVFLAAQTDPPDLLILLQDTDGDVEVRDGAKQVVALAKDLGGPRLVIGLPHRDAEAWLCAGWKPTSREEKQRLKQARTALTFDPTTEPERLSASPNDAITDAKRVLRFLLLGEGEHLRHGSPESRPPNTEADELASALAARLQEGEHPECGLADLQAQLRSTLSQLLSPPQ